MRSERDFHTFSRLLLPVILACTALSSAAAGQVVINEVLFHPVGESADAGANHQWVEIYNKGSEPVDLGGWILSGREGPEAPNARRLPQVVLPARGFLVVHIAEGTSRLDFGETAVEYYTQDAAATRLWNPDSGDVALYSPERIVDYIAWSSLGLPYHPGAAHAAAVDAGIWQQGISLNRDSIASGPAELVRHVRPGETVGRNAEAEDTNSPSDFDAHGGSSALGATPGRRNVDRITLPSAPAGVPAARKRAQRNGVVPIEPRVPRKRWTVAMYLSCDAPDIQQACFEYLKQIEQALSLRGVPFGEAAEHVNFVVLLDTFDSLKGEFPDGATRNVSLFGHVVNAGLNLHQAPIVSPHAGQAPLIPEKNMGDPATLSAFLREVRQFYPADRQMLILAGHGKGWKSFGSDLTWKDDIASPPQRGEFAAFDALYTRELSDALAQDKAAGGVLDIIAFNSCLMGNLEVAVQLAGRAEFLVASEQVMRATGLPFAALTHQLAGGRDDAASTVAFVLVDSFRDHQRTMGAPDRGQSLSAIRLDSAGVANLAEKVDKWADQLRKGVALFNRRTDASDNVQNHIHIQLLESLQMVDRNFVDLGNLALRIFQDPDIPACAKGEWGAVVAAIRDLLVAQALSPDMERAHGLTIYFPEFRSGSLPPHPLDEYFDYVESRPTSGDSRLVVYSPSHDQLPFQARTMEQPTIGLPRTDWPAPAANLEFVDRYPNWHRFLERYYHPVADNRVESPPAEQRSNGDCTNPNDYISVPVGTKVALTGKGSSDADMPLLSITPLAHYWDLDSNNDCRTNCVAPSAVPAGSEAHLTSTDNIDQDRNTTNTLWDDRDKDGDSAEFECKAAGSYVVTLFVWDDNHRYPFHNTNPSAPYVHPQSGHHQAFIECVATAAAAQSSGLPPFNQAGTLVASAWAFVGANGMPIANLPLSIGPVENITDVTVSGRSTYNVGAGEKRTVVTNERGVMILRFVTGNPGTGAINFDVPGLGPNPFRFAIANRLAMPVDDVVLAAPTTVAVGQQANIMVEARRGGQPLRDAIVTLAEASGSSGNAEFLNGTRFRRDRATQLRTGADGRATAQFRPGGPGPILLEVFADRVIKPLMLNATGGASGPATRVEFLNAPEFVELGQEVMLRLRVVAIENPVGNQTVQLTHSQGSIAVRGTPVAGPSTFLTDARGEATFTFTATDVIPLRFQAIVPGTSVTAQHNIFVRLP